MQQKISGRSFDVCSTKRKILGSFVMKKDIWDMDYRPININKDHLQKWENRYRMSVRFVLEKIKTEEEFQRDKNRVLSRLLK
jgi:c-di-GMP-related signal transduction protein